MPVFKIHGNIDQLHKNQMNKFKCSWNKKTLITDSAWNYLILCPYWNPQNMIFSNLEKPWAEVMQQAVFNQNFTQMSSNSTHIIQANFRLASSCS